MSQEETIRKELDEVRTVMHHNIDGMLHRGEQLVELEKKTQALALLAVEFRTGAESVNTRIARTQRTRAVCKWVIIGGSIIGILVVVIISIVVIISQTTAPMPTSTPTQLDNNLTNTTDVI